MVIKLDQYTKAAVVLGVRDGLLSRQDACKKYSVSAGEFALWERAYRQEGITGLRDKNLSAFRRINEASPRPMVQTGSPV
jgi:transposase